MADWELSQTDIALAVSDKIETINLNASLTEVLHKLVDNPFLPVVTDNNSFVGIITRKAVLKAVNALLHEFTDHYSITKK
ncbi:putative transcriptional regulator [Streptococcus porcorum]|uniref:Transcriptional regulator n=1 Tax=Streptococcus porcorum TaxID=701526 RepID=A0ABV2JGE1_9STRE